MSTTLRTSRTPYGSAPSFARLATLAAICVLGPGRLASGQAQIRDFTRPFVTLQTGGHHAPVRALAFSEDGRWLYSGGLDKLVLVSDLDDPRPGLARTIRPPQWRGLRGSIYAIAVGPDDPQGRRLVALAGDGVLRGEIGLYRDPSPTGPATGDRVATLPPFDPARPDSTGHARAVTGLAFLEGGSRLVSCGADGRVLLWNVEARRVSTVLTEAGPSPANALTLDGRGRRLAVGFGDGRVVVWDLAAGVVRAEGGPWRAEGGDSRDPEGAAINALDLSPDGRWLVIGRENGRLVRVECPFLTNPVLLPRGGLGRGPVEALAISPDGRRVAVALVRSRWTDPTTPPRVDSEVRVLRLFDGSALPPTYGVDPIDYARSETPAGASDGPSLLLDDRARALAYDPDGRRIVVAGGSGQAIQIVVPNRPVVRLRGEGSSVRRVAFHRDGGSILLTRPRVDLGGDQSEILGFELATRRVRVAAPAEAAPKSSIGDWQVTPLGAYSLDVSSAAAGRRFRVELDPARFGRWWDYAFIPGRAEAGHPVDTLAVASEGGVVVHNLETTARTRVFSGHTGGILSLAPSPDGRWLVTGSDDQTARLWSLQGCDRPPPLGATFAAPDAQGRRVVSAVDPLGFAEAMGLQVGDALEVLAVVGVARPIEEVIGQLDEVEPGDEIAIGVRRAGEFVPLTTTRRDAPALSLFVTANRDWVAWMPEGYYDTLLAGDRDALGWHRNGPLSVAADGSITLEPTDRFEAETFEADLRRPEILDRLIATGDRAQALALVPANAFDPGALAESAAPPTLQLLAPADRPAVGPLRVVGGELVVAVRAETDPASPLRSLTVAVDGRTVVPPLVLDPPAPGRVDREFRVPLLAGRQRISVLAENSSGRRRRLRLDVEAVVEPAQTPRLAVLTLAAGGPFAGPGVPPIRFADADALDLAEFLTAPDGRPRFDRVEPLAPIEGLSASASAILGAFASPALADLGAGDSAFVSVEAHILGIGTDRVVLGNDSTAEGPTGRVLANALGDTLIALAGRGCRVVLLIDGEHEPSPGGPFPRLAEWARELSRGGVIVLLASEVGPSRRLAVEGRGVFAHAVITSAEARSQSRPTLDPDSPMTLDDFRVVVLDRVAELSARRQFAACLIPETISPTFPIFEPAAEIDATPDPSVPPLRH